MLAAVSNESQYFDSLRDRILVGNKRPPPDVPAAAVEPRLPNKPGDATPGPKAKIPTSSQRPGKRTNDTIPYGRMVFTAFNESPADPSDMLPGDLLMVHKTKDCLGHDTNRASKAATWRQINAVLGKTARIGGTVLGPGMDQAMVDARSFVEDGLLVAYTFAEHDSQEMYRNPIPGGRGVELRSGPQDVSPEYLASMQQLYNHWQNLMQDTASLRSKMAGGNHPAIEFIPDVDWRAVSFLNEWGPDGMLMSRDDDEQNASYYHAGGGDSGTMLNIAIQGPAATRNAFDHKYSKAPVHKFSSEQGEFWQVFDPEPRIRDTLYLVLICKKVEDAAGNLLHFSFYYKPTSERIIDEWRRRHRLGAVQNPDSGWPVASCISYTELRHACAVWRVGTVMDNRLVKHPEVKIQVNVSISEMTLLEFRSDEFKGGWTDANGVQFPGFIGQGCRGKVLYPAQ